MLHYLRVDLRITITQSHTHTMQQTHTHKVVTRRIEAKKLLSRQRQSEYSNKNQNLINFEIYYGLERLKNKQTNKHKDDGKVHELQRLHLASLYFDACFSSHVKLIT